MAPQIVGGYDDWNKTVHGIYYYFSLPPNDQQISIATKLTKGQRNQYKRTIDNLMTNRPLPYFTTIRAPSKLSSRQNATQFKKFISLSAERSQQKQQQQHVTTTPIETNKNKRHVVSPDNTHDLCAQCEFRLTKQIMKTKQY